MNKLYLTLVCLTVTAFAVSSADAFYKKGRSCRNGECARSESKERKCESGACHRKSRCHKERCVEECKTCPKQTYKLPTEHFCVEEEYCEAVPTVKLVPDTKYVKVKCTSRINKECCVKEGEECTPDEAAGMVKLEDAPEHIKKAIKNDEAAYTPAAKKRK